MAAFLSSFSLHAPKQNISCTSAPALASRRGFAFEIATLFAAASLSVHTPVALSAAVGQPPPPSKSILSGIVNTKSWFLFYGDGFSIRVPPEFEDIMEPEDFNAGLSLYGDKAKPKTFVARFASPDGSEVVNVIMRSTNQLKITFLEAQDITDLGSLKEAANFFVPGGAALYTARTIKIKEDEGFKSLKRPRWVVWCPPPVQLPPLQHKDPFPLAFPVPNPKSPKPSPLLLPYFSISAAKTFRRTYYYYEFGRDEQHVALVAAVKGGKAYIAGATAPESKWDNCGVKLRSAAISLTLL